MFCGAGVTKSIYGYRAGCTKIKWLMRLSCKAGVNHDSSVLAS